MGCVYFKGSILMRNFISHACEFCEDVRIFSVFISKNALYIIVAFLDPFIGDRPNHTAVKLFRWRAAIALNLVHLSRYWRHTSWLQ